MAHKIIWKGERKPIEEDNKVTMKIDCQEFEVNLPLYLEEVNHSPTGFEWGYLGSGPAQLAYAILRTFFEHVGDLTPESSEREAHKYYQDFKYDIVCHKFGRSTEWEIGSDEVDMWLGGKFEGWA